MKKNSIGKNLFDKYKGATYKYKDLPPYAKSSIDVYYVEEFDKEISDEQLFGYVEIPLNELKSAIGVPGELNCVDFDDYHRWYLNGGDIPNHEDVWPIILDGYDNEVIWDGWHRFHCYVKKEIENIPCILPMFG